jgi:hypothetical protein
MDFATTMDALSWEFYNRFFNVLVDYGVVYLYRQLTSYTSPSSDYVEEL